MRRRAHLLATAALFTALGSAVTLGSASLIPSGGYPTVSQRIVNSLALANGYVSTLNAILSDPLGNLV
ncbi:hypothetical protein ACIHFD_02950 [Nonomuraea sp. NPDC051941]|uniref:hypothetical protein n=1 Tax=unclassified Nonomuraea TaxID=2593643 RepID=UPI0033A1CAED